MKMLDFHRSWVYKVLNSPVLQYLKKSLILMISINLLTPIKDIYLNYSTKV
ncbi:MAG: hypothetical protein LC437_00015 [Thiohalomonas sp.]|nr:hypothetical protein [Thiohalomonas sp.]